MTILLLWTRLLPSGIKRLMLHEDMTKAMSIPMTICSLLPDMQHRFSAKVRIFLLYDLGHGEIAAADEDHIVEMRIIDGRTVGMTDGLEYLSAQTHVEGFLG